MTLRNPPWWVTLCVLPVIVAYVLMLIAAVIVMLILKPLMNAKKHE